LQLALSGGMSGAGESARWLRRRVRSQRTGRLLCVRVLRDAVCSDNGALAAGVLTQAYELAGLLRRRAGR